MTTNTGTILLIEVMLAVLYLTLRHLRKEKNE